jgi:exodeoxyribonuclease VII large subunit
LTGAAKTVILFKMRQLPLFKSSTWSVTEVTRYLRSLIESDDRLQDVWVIGEISNCSRSSNGHLYFTLKDNSAALRCVMWRTTVLRQKFIPREGDAVEVHGGLGIYEQNGAYQLYADEILPAGEGLLFKEFLLLKARLEAEGLFDPDRKRLIPVWPKRLGVVTSPTGAALRDILNVLHRRCPSLEVVIAPTPVQGEEAPSGIASALDALNRVASPDIILLARGGGSIEDLQAFNDERVARAIVRSCAPVISGVGHETDFTIADFAADLRAPTPTAAAELASPDQAKMKIDLDALRQRLKDCAVEVLVTPRWMIKDLQKRLQFYSPANRLRSDRQVLDDLALRMEKAMNHRMVLFNARLHGLESRLNSLNPASVLARGFAIVSTPEGILIKSVDQTHPGDPMVVQLNDGKLDVNVNKVERTGGDG